MISSRNIELPAWYGQWLSLGIWTSFKLKQTSHLRYIYWRSKIKWNAFSLSTQVIYNLYQISYKTWSRSSILFKTIQLPTKLE